MPRPAMLPPVEMSLDELAQRLLLLPVQEPVKRSDPDTSDVSRSSPEPSGASVRGCPDP